MNAIKFEDGESQWAGKPAGAKRLPDQCRAMQRVWDIAKKIAPSSLSVLILGECGVGKDVLARMLHSNSPRADKPFVAINCGAIPESLMAAELFGHAPGAYSGAAARGKVGLFESAGGGTVFLDEIGDMPLSMQVALLRAIETREVRPVMATKTVSLDVRFLAATNKNLKTAVTRGEFRSDLMYRLNTMTVSIPPLRRRTDEIVELALSFVDSAARSARRARTPTLSIEVIDWLKSYQWPGNIRELKNMMDCAVVLADGPEIRLEHLPVDDGLEEHFEPRTLDEPIEDDELQRFRGCRPEDTEKERIVLALAESCGNQTRAARMLRMSRRTFCSKLDYYELPRPRKNAPLALVSFENKSVDSEFVGGIA